MFTLEIIENEFCFFEHSQAKESDSTLAAELEKVKQQNKELQEENKLLHSKGIDLQLQVDDLLEELSRKEAEWCSKEEKLMLEVISFRSQEDSDIKR